MAGNIKVIKPGRNYEQVSKAIIFDEKIGLATLGFFCKVISLSDKWELNVAGLASLMNISHGKVQKALAELEEAGYLKREKSQSKDGRFCGWNYTFYNLPTEYTDNEKNRQSENTDVGENRRSENEGVYIRPIKNTRPLSGNDKPIREGAAPSFDFYRELLSLGVTEQTANDWMEVRRAKRGVNTRSALDDVLCEIRKAGISVQDGIAFAAAHSWRGFNASWYQNAKAEESSPKAPSFVPARKSEKVTIDDMIHRYCGGSNTDLDLDEQ